jgi:hypothetical protein
VLASEPVVHKRWDDGFDGTGLDELLRRSCRPGGGRRDPVGVRTPQSVDELVFPDES